jgi:hypothetical protein
VAGRVAPGASVRTGGEGDLVRVVVSDRARIGVGPLAVTVRLRAEAVTAVEPAPAAVGGPW